MEDELTTMEIIAEFTTPFDDHLTVLTLGDKIDVETREEITEVFNNLREDFADSLELTTELEPIRYMSLTTSELFRGVGEDILNNDPCVIFLDSELSKDVVNILSNNVDDVDDLDYMLIDKYLISVRQERFVLDISDCDNDRVDRILSEMDFRIEEFNYIILDDLLVIWIYDMDLVNF